MAGSSPSSPPDALSGWSLHPGPLYERISRAVELAIARGDLRPGMVLPPERTLARQLAVGRSTVVAAYDDLRSRGVLESRRGSGTWVAGAARNAADDDARTDSLTGAALESSPMIDLATARLPTAAAVRAAVDDLGGELLDAVLARSGYSPAGLPELRRAVADMFCSEGLPTTPEQILITTGNQQALALVIGHASAAGDEVVVEDPTSPGALDLLRHRACVIKGAPSLARGGEAGFVEALRRINPTVAYVMSAGGPEGLVVQHTQVRRLGAAMRKVDALVIEDAASRPLVLDEPPPYLAQVGPSERVVTIGSMSKVFWGGLRVGWVRAEEPVIHRLTREKRRVDLGTPMLSQVASVWLLHRLDEVRQERLHTLAGQYSLAERLFRQYLPEFEFTRPAAGVTAWVRLPRGSSGPFVELARRHGVTVVAGDTLSVGGLGDQYIRVAVGQPGPVLEAGLLRLASAWRGFERRTSPGAPREVDAHVAL